MIRYLESQLLAGHRMYSISENNPRVALRDCILPVGGGQTGASPIFVCKGEYISFNIYCLHHDGEIWGEDADKFRPERWEGFKPLWNFIPFGGGPRTCPAQQLVTTEAAYVIARMAQEIETLQATDEQNWTEAWRLGPYSKFGCTVACSFDSSI